MQTSINVHLHMDLIFQILFASLVASLKCADCDTSTNKAEYNN